jgi:DNA repair exonuclease SbcCD nuclease subunit
MPNRPLRFLHTSDCHLDLDMPWRDGKHLTSEYFAAFRRVVDTAIELDVDMLLIAGDFFESNRASEVSTDFALEQFARLNRPAIICPGNHDCFDPGSVYHRIDFNQGAGTVYVLSDIAGQKLEFPELGAVIWGRAATERDRLYRPLAGIPARQGDFWHIAIAHGHFMDDENRDQRWGPISAAELAAIDWDYLALGHWDNFADVTRGSMPALYSGAPVAHPWAGAGACLLVTLDPVAGFSAQRIHLPVNEGEAITKPD